MLESQSVYAHNSLFLRPLRLSSTPFESRPCSRPLDPNCSRPALTLIEAILVMGANCSCFSNGNPPERTTNVEIHRITKASQQHTPAVDVSYHRESEASLQDKFTLLAVLRMQAVLRGYVARRKARNLLRRTYQTKTDRDSFTVSVAQSPAIASAIAAMGSFVYDSDLRDGVSVSRRPPFELEKGSIYTGEWNSMGQRHGRGIQVWVDGSLYEGYWSNDKASGKGRLFHADGDVYEGEWRDDKAHGLGTYTHSDGASYKGGWDQDKQHGFGVEIWPDGARYEGQYKNGKKEGRGKFKWGDNSTYEGEFRDNNINGVGIYRWADGRQFVGDWRDNKMHGRGVFSWADGRRYEGDYFEDKKDGWGVFVWPDGRRYEGRWRWGKQHGRGKYTQTNGVMREGEWLDGKRVKWIDDN